MKKTSAIHAMIFGIGIGIPVTLSCMILMGGFAPVLREFLIWTVASALYGLISYLMGWLEENMAMPLALGLHCLGCASITIAAVFLCGYVENLLQLVCCILPVFAVIYLLIFCGITFAIKQEEKRINQALENK